MNERKTVVAYKWYSRTIDFVAKTSGMLLALLYFSGLLIVNAHLSRFGVARMGLIDSKYIIAGVWYVILGGICFRMYKEASLLLKQEVPYRLNFLLAMGSFFGQLFVVNILLSFIAERGEKLPEQLNWNVGIAVLFVFVVSSGVALFIADVIGKLQVKFFAILRIISSTAYSILFGLVLFSVCKNLYSFCPLCCYFVHSDPQ